MLTYAMVAPASAARRAASGSRTSSLFRSYGEPLMQLISPTSARAATANGPPSCQRSSQMVSATSTPRIRTTTNRSPGTK